MWLRQAQLISIDKCLLVWVGNQRSDSDSLVIGEALSGLKQRTMFSELRIMLVFAYRDFFDGHEAYIY